jgi:hypothetical protein
MLAEKAGHFNEETSAERAVPEKCKGSNLLLRPATPNFQVIPDGGFMGAHDVFRWLCIADSYSPLLEFADNVGGAGDHGARVRNHCDVRCVISEAS